MARAIIKILRVRDMGKYKLTDALFDDGGKATAYTPLDEKFKVGDLCEVFFDHKYGKIKFQRSKNDARK